jgi:methionyl-tRNA formyltransferase
MASLKGARVFYIGCVETSYDTLKTLLQNEVKIDYLITLSEEKAKTSKVSEFVDLSPLAESHQIPLYFPSEYSMKSKQDVSFFQQEKPDLLIVCGWQRLIPKEILASSRLGAIGFHGRSEFLPKGRGRSPINWSLIEGKDIFILQMFFYDEYVDSGNIIGWEILDINPFDTVRTIYYKATIASARLTLKFLPLILEDKAPHYPQLGEPSYYPKRTPEDGRIDWNKSTDEIYNLIRGVTKPYPGAFSFLGERKVTLWRAQPFSRRLITSKVPGVVMATFSSGDFVVSTKDGSLLIYEYEGINREDIQEGMTLA